MTNENKKIHVLQLISDWKSDSKSKSEKAEKKLISICEPIVKHFYEIAEIFGNPHNMKEWPCDYVADRGAFESVTDFTGTELEFYYIDGYFYKEYIQMPIHWLDEGADKNYFEYCKSKALLKAENKLKELKEDYSKSIELLEKKINEIQNINYKIEKNE